MSARLRCPALLPDGKRCKATVSDRRTLKRHLAARHVAAIVKSAPLGYQPKDLDEASRTEMKEALKALGKSPDAPWPPALYVSPAMLDRLLLERSEGPDVKRPRISTSPSGVLTSPVSVRIERIQEASGSESGDPGSEAEASTTGERSDDEGDVSVIDDPSSSSAAPDAGSMVDHAYLQWLATLPVGPCPGCDLSRLICADCVSSVVDSLLAPASGGKKRSSEASRQFRRREAFVQLVTPSTSSAPPPPCILCDLTAGPCRGCVARHLPGRLAPARRCPMVARSTSPAVPSLPLAEGSSEPQ